MSKRSLVTLLLSVFLVASAIGPVLHAQALSSSASSGDAPAPVPPAVVARDGAGHVTVRAVRVSGPMHVDGQLDEEVYSTTESISDFVQH